MKIAIINDALLTGGSERQAVLGAAELGRCGHQVELITYHLGNDFTWYIRDRGIRWVRIDARGFLRIRRIRALARHLRNGGFDIAHCFSHFTAITGTLAAALAGIPVVGGCRVEYRQPAVVRLIHKMVDRFVYCWVVNSRGIVDTFSRATGIDRHKCVVVYNGIDTETFTSGLDIAQAKERIGLDPRHHVVSIIAKLRPQKNHPLFLELASVVLEERSDTRFVIVGDGETRSSLEELARSLRIADRVLFLGTRPDVPELLAATDVSVLTSHYEGLANALVESMCMGVPVVTTDYLGVEELVTDQQEGFIVPRGDARTMARKLCRLLDDPQLRATMGQRGRETVERRFSAQAMARNLLNIYESCLQRVGEQAGVPGG